MDTPFIPLSIFVTNSYKFPLHQLIQLAGLNTWKSGKASTSQCGWLIRDQFSRTFFDSLISVYLACRRVGDWTAIPIKTWKKTDICLFRIFFCSFHLALFWVEVFAHLAQELSVNIALLLNDVPQGRRERQSWHKEHVSVNGERGPSDVAYWCLFGYVWFCLKAYRIEVYFMGLTPAPAGCRRTMWIECFWDTMRELASEAAGTVSVADHCWKACPMLSMIFPQPPHASPIPNFRIRGKNWMCTESSAQWNLNGVCPSGRSKAANQLQLLQQFLTKNRSLLPAGVAVNLSDNVAPNLQPSAAQKDTVDSADCWKFHVQISLPVIFGFHTLMCGHGVMV